MTTGRSTIEVMKVRQVIDQAEWDGIVSQGNGHPLQLWGWGELKAKHNWSAYRLVIEDGDQLIGGAQVLQRKLPWLFKSMLYVPRGPIGEINQVLPHLTDYLKVNYKASHVAIEPHLIGEVTIKGWRHAPKAILLPRTVILDLRQSEDDLLSRMSKKTRQYIRKSAKSGVIVREGRTEDIDRCLEIYKQTAERAGFSLHNDDYYKDLHQVMGNASKIFVAEYGGRVVAFLWLAVSGEVAFELYGGMDDVGQEVRANYTLKWETIRAMKATDVRQYDMNGLLNDGVSNFKKGFSPDETMLAGTYEYPLSPWYYVWRSVFPAAKKLVQTLATLRK